MNEVFLLKVFPPDSPYIDEKCFATLELVNAYLDKNYPGMDDSMDNDGWYEIEELEVIKELD